jgi:hypothetical protein
MVFAKDGEATKSAAENASPNAAVMVAGLRIFFPPEIRVSLGISGIRALSMADQHWE